ncbi:EpsG family protein [Cytobacillus purgationiresistens]|uniref:Transmembrane protein EpsG n=1 Tax=Cytobacillus purgationiresistens TaxID=863449 RepID=A0ABU0AI48_9BACI|nr:EpsG family protein [Cytobacillus purgationiresistens]MDQ0270927.1 transmembrane protein EpsG [Cytobacillus purgationiresistens]
MTFLWINLSLVFVLSFFARYFARPVASAGIYAPVKPNQLLVLGVMCSLVAVSGLRINIGDTYFYRHAYENNEITWSYISSQKDIGFSILQMLLKNLSEDPQILIFTTALITNVLIVYVLSKYSRMFELSIYVYITGGLFLVSMNGIRQMLAAAIIFTATRFLINGNWLMYIFIVLLASLFHQSALILIPIYFLVRYKAWSKATYLLLACSVIIVIGYDQFSNILFAAMENTQYSGYSSFQEGGANTLRVAVNAVPLMIAFLGRHKLREIYPSSDYIVNMVLVGFIFMVISTQNWIFARVSIYFTLYQLILISWIIVLFRTKEQRFIYYALLICYLAYYFYENVISLNTIYKSNILNQLL